MYIIENHNGKNYYCYRADKYENGDEKGTYFCQLDNFSSTNGVLQVEPSVCKFNTCNVNAMCRALSCIGYDFPDGDGTPPEKLARFINNNEIIQKKYKAGKYDYSANTIHDFLYQGTNLWMGQKVVSKFSTDTNLNDVIRDLVDNYPCVVSGNFRDCGGVGGHVVCLIGIAFTEEYSTGKIPDYYIIDDPYGKTVNSELTSTPTPAWIEPIYRGGTQGKNVWLTRAQFNYWFNKRTNKDGVAEGFYVHRFVREVGALASQSWDEFTNTVTNMTLPSKLGNMNDNDDNWFSESSITSYLYYSGYKKINGEYKNFVRLFDDIGDVEGFSNVIDGKNKIEYTGNFIDNICNEKKDDCIFDAEELKEYFAAKNSKTYLFGGYSAQKNKPLGVFFRYGNNLKNTSSKLRKLIYINNSDLMYDEYNKIFGILKQTDIDKQKNELEHIKKQIPNGCTREDTTLSDITDTDLTQPSTYEDSEIFYLNKKSHGLLGWNKATSVPLQDTVSEISYDITSSEMRSLSLSNFEFVGFRIYFNGKTISSSPSFKKYISTDIASSGNTAITELAFYFRYKNNKKLYRYIINLNKYQTVINNFYHNTAVYFIPLLINLEEEGKFYNLYEGWYDNDGNLLTKRSYVQFGNFEGDLYNINNKTTSSYIGVTNDYVTYSNSWNIDDAEKYIPDEFDKEKSAITLTAADLQNVIVGCFTNTKPNSNQKPTGWATSNNTGSINVTLSSNGSTGLNTTYKNTAKIIDGENITDFGVIELEKIADNKMDIIEFKYNDGTTSGVTYDENNIPKNYCNTINIPYESGDWLYKAKFNLLTKYSTDENGKITSIFNNNSNRQKATEFKVSDNGAAVFEVVSDNMVKYAKEISKCVNSSGNKDELSNCSIYINEMGYVVHGYNFSYAICETLDDESNLKKQFDIWLNNYKKYCYIYNGEYNIFKEPPKSYDEYIKNKDKYAKKYKEFIKSFSDGEVENGVLYFPSYTVNDSDTNEVFKKIISNSKIDLVIDWLKRFAIALDGNSKTDLETAELQIGLNVGTLEKHVAGNISQKCYETLIAFAYSSEDELNRLCKPILNKIANKVNKSRGKSDADKKSIFEEMAGDVIAEAIGTNSTIKDKNAKNILIENAKEFKIVNRKEVGTYELYKSSDTDHDEKKLTLEVTCIAISSGLLESAMGKGFVKLMSK